MSIIKDIYNFINSLSFVDFVFIVAVIVLLILIVILIYFIRINGDVLDEHDLLDIKVNNDKKEDIVEKIISKDEEEVKKGEEKEYNDEEGELLDLEGLTKKLEKEKMNEELKIDNYEKEQEEKAIISYDELLKKKNHYAINYEKEEDLGDLVIKKVNLNDLVNKEEEEENKSTVKVISYQKEEEFLKALKELNSLLN